MRRSTTWRSGRMGRTSMRPSVRAGIRERFFRSLQTGRLIALDADPDAIARAQAISDPSFTFVHANFSELRRVLNDCGVAQVDGVLFDLGVSSMQLDNAERGFSFRDSAPLDMRMNPYRGRSAYEILSTASESELADIFFMYGEERAARRIARAIVERRTAGKLPKTTVRVCAVRVGRRASAGQARAHPSGHARLPSAAHRGQRRARACCAKAWSPPSTRCARADASSRSVFIRSRIASSSTRSATTRASTSSPKSRSCPSEREMAENPRARSAKLRAAQRKAS